MTAQQLLERLSDLARDVRIDLSLVDVKLVDDYGAVRNIGEARSDFPPDGPVIELISEAWTS